jgi:cytochrome b561
MSTHTEYDSRSIALHWVTAFLVVAQWVGAHLIDEFPRGPLRVDARSVHIVVGVLLLVIVIVRVAWRLTRGRQPEPSGPTAVRVLAPIVHWALYALLGAVLVAGVLNVIARGDSIFGLWKVPAYSPNDKELRAQVGSIHELLANSVLILAGLHACAAALHGRLWGNGVLGRMIPALRPQRHGRS